jgi:hypothetical protein
MASINGRAGRATGRTGPGQSTAGAGADRRMAAGFRGATGHPAVPSVRLEPGPPAARLEPDFTLTPPDNGHMAIVEPIQTLIIGRMVGHPELPLVTCIECDSQLPIPTLAIACAVKCGECNTDHVFHNGILSIAPSRAPSAGMVKKTQTVLHVASMEVREVEIKTPTHMMENNSICIECYKELSQVLSCRVSKFSHVGSREIQQNTFPYLPKKVYFPVYVKGRMCEACASTLTPDTKVLNDDATIGIWRTQSGIEVNILMETERNRVYDGQSIKGMTNEIKREHAEPDPVDSWSLMRIDGMDEPIVLSMFATKGTQKVDVAAYNAIFGKRQVNRYGRHVIEPGFNDREK